MSVRLNLLRATAMAAALLVAPAGNMSAQAKPRAQAQAVAAPVGSSMGSSAGPSAGSSAGEPLGADLDRALQLDAQYQGLLAGRGAESARNATVASPIAGSPYLSGTARSDTRGPERAREFEAEVGAPIWLPGQRSAMGAEVSARVRAADGSAEFRRLQVAGLLRTALWQAAAALREQEMARQRVAAARDIARDVARRAALGDISQQDALLGPNEVLAAELQQTEADAAADQALAQYAAMTGGSTPRPVPETEGRPVANHPALRSAEAALRAAEAHRRYVQATPRDQPEVGFFAQHQEGRVTEQNVSLGLRVRVPLATEARNTPRLAQAEAEVTQATARLAEAKRLVDAEQLQAGRALGAARQALRVAQERLAVAQRQMNGARLAFRNGETGLFDLYRVRQLEVDAQIAAGQAEVAVGRAVARVNQADGVLPGTVATTR